MKFKKGDHIIRTNPLVKKGTMKTTKGHIVDVKENKKYVIVWRGSYHRQRILCTDIDWVSELDPVETRNVKLEDLLK